MAPPICWSVEVRGLSQSSSFIICSLQGIVKDMKSLTLHLLLCSFFTSIAPALGEGFRNKRVAFIPTAAAHEEYTAYVDSARSSWKELGSNITDVDIARMPLRTATEALEQAEIIYLSGGNSFYLLDCLRSTEIDQIIRGRLAEGAILVGESAGAIVCSPNIAYIQPMDRVPDNYSQADYTGLNLVDFFPVPHYLAPPFVKSSKEVVAQHASLPLELMNNAEAVIVEGPQRTKISSEHQ